MHNSPWPSFLDGIGNGLGYTIMNYASGKYVGGKASGSTMYVMIMDLVFKAMEQATEEAEKRKDGVPVVFHKRTRTGFLVTMRIQDWICIYKDAMRWREHGKDK